MLKNFSLVGAVLLFYTPIAAVAGNNLTKDESLLNACKQTVAAKLSPSVAACIANVKQIQRQYEADNAASQTELLQSQSENEQKFILDYEKDSAESTRRSQEILYQQEHDAKLQQILDSQPKNTICMPMQVVV